MSDSRFKISPATRFVTITITEEDRLLRVSPQNLGENAILTYWDGLELRVGVTQEGATEEETVALAKARFLGVMARNAAVRDIMALENGVLQSARETSKGPRMHSAIGEPGVGKTHLFRTQRDALAHDSVFLDARGAGIGSENQGASFFVESLISAADVAPLVDRINTQLNIAADQLRERFPGRTLADALKEAASGQNTTQQIMLQYLQSLELVNVNEQTFSLDVQKLKQLETADTLLNVEKLFLPQESTVPVMIQRDGPLLTALKHVKDTGRPLLINFDEFNHLRQGDELRAFMAWLGAEDAGKGIFECKDANGVTVRLEAKDRQNILLIGGANEPGKDEPTAIVQSASANSRQRVTHISPKLRAEDYADRLAKMLMDFPLVAHLQAAENYGLTAEQKLELLNRKLTEGLTEAEQRASAQVPLAQALFGNADNVSRGLLHMGNAMMELKGVFAERPSKERIVSQHRREIPPMDGRVFDTLVAYVGDKLNDSDVRIDTNGRLVKGPDGKPIYPYKVYDDEGKVETATTPENVGERLVKAIKLYCDELFPLSDKNNSQLNVRIGEILARNRLISMDEARDVYGVQIAAASELNTQAATNRLIDEATNKPEELVPGLVRRAPMRFAAADIEAAQLYLYGMAKRNYPDLASLSFEQFKTGLGNTTVVQSLLEDMHRCHKKDGGPLLPRLSIEDNALTLTHQPAERAGGEEWHARHNRASEVADFASVLVQTLTRNVDNPNAPLLLDLTFENPLQDSLKAVCSAALMQLLPPTTIISNPKTPAEAKRVEKANELLAIVEDVAKVFVSDADYTITGREGKGLQELIAKRAAFVAERLAPFEQYLNDERALQKENPGPVNLTDLAASMAGFIGTKVEEYEPLYKGGKDSALDTVVDISTLMLRRNAEGSEVAPMRVVRFIEADKPAKFLLIGSMQPQKELVEQLGRAGISWLNIGDTDSVDKNREVLNNWLDRRDNRVAELQGITDVSSSDALSAMYRYQNNSLVQLPSDEAAYLGTKLEAVSGIQDKRAALVKALVAPFTQGKLLQPAYLFPATEAGASAASTAAVRNNVTATKAV